MSSSKSLLKSEKPVSEERLLRLLKRDDLHLYDINQLLRGTSLDLYCVLVIASNEQGRCQITQRELMKLTGIGNSQTLHKQETWLESLHLIKRFVHLGDSKGTEYKVYALSSLPLSQEILDQLDSHLENYRQLLQNLD